MKKSKESFRLGLLTADASIDAYIKSQIPEIEIVSLLDGDELTGIDALFLFDSMRERQERCYQIARERLEQGVKVIWYVEYDDLEKQQKVEEELRSLGAYVHSDMLSDAAGMVHIITEFYETLNPPANEDDDRERPRGKKAGAATVSSDFVDDGFDGEEVVPIGETFRNLRDDVSNVLIRRLKDPEALALAELPETVENVVAVSGFPGAGTSFIAWNLARVFDKPVVLVEGRKTGALAKWLGRKENLTHRDLLVKANESTQISEFIDVSLLAEKPISNQELLKMSKLPRLMVVDCGDQWDLEVYKRAFMRVFVTSTDPKYLDLERPKISSHVTVLNQFPFRSPINVREFERRFNLHFDLVVPARPRQVMVSNWTGRAWILMEPEDIAKWKRAFNLGHESELSTYGKGRD